MTHRSAKSKEEVRGRITSVRLTEEQHMTIQKKAADKHTTVSKYMIEAAIHEGGKLTPEFMVALQNFTNKASTALKEKAPEKAAELEREVDELWQKLL